MVYHRMPVLLLLVSKCSPMLQNYMRVHVITEKQNFNTILVLYMNMLQLLYQISSAVSRTDVLKIHKCQ